MKLERKTARRWEEPARFVTALLWIAVLAVWTYSQTSFFYVSLLWPEFNPSPAVASVALRTFRPLWFASLFPAVAFGLAWYVFLHRGLPQRTGVRCGLDRLTTMQNHATFCIAICAFLLNYRLLPIMPFLTSGVERLAEPLNRLWWGGVGFGDVPLVELHATIGILAMLVVATRAWGLLPRLDGRRVRIVALSGLSLAAGCAVPLLGLLEPLSAAPKLVFGLDARRPEVRGLLLGDPAYARETEALLSDYYFTHDDDGDVIPLYRLRANWLPDWRDFERWERSRLLCQLCQLPGSVIWTLGGLPVRLSPEPPTAPEPVLVLEVPRLFAHGRIYAAREVGDVTTVPLTEALSRIGSADWLVAKIDFAVTMEDVASLLGDLRDRGVRRVDLAVLSHAFEPLPPDVPLLKLAGDGTAAIYEPAARPLEDRGNVIIVKKYVPPPGLPRDPRPECAEVSEDLYNKAWQRYLADPPDSLPERVRIPIDPQSRYGDFVGVLQGAITGGAKTIELALEPNGGKR